jgi:serine/threonine-protein kinase
MSEVFRARDLRLKRKVAIKVLRPQLADDPESLPRFIREAQSAARLIHPNIVNIYDIEEFEGSHYIVMEYLEAESLKDIIYKNAPFDREKTLDVFRQIASAVKYAHENGIIHRDLKPQNVLVSEQGTLKVTDFGIARAVTSSSLTQTGTMMGSVQYFSPEQAQGKTVDKTTDIYSLGIILFECLTGKLPFEADNMVAVAFKQVQEPPPSPSFINSSLGREIDRAVLKALEKDPADRYQDVDEMLREVERAFLGRGASAPAREEPPVVESTLVMKPGSAPFLVKARAARDEDDDGEEDEKEGGEDASSRGNAFYVGILIVFLILITIIFARRGNLIPVLARDNVPDLAGLSLQKARGIADEKGWLIQIAEERYDESAGEGIILSHSPAPGEKLQRGGSIMVVISGGKRMVEVPNLTGMKMESAAEELTRLGLKWTVQNTVFDDRLEKDVVISHDPAAHEMVTPGRKILLTLSKGAEQIEIPDLLGMTREEAVKAVSPLGLTIVVIGKEPSGKYPEGCITTQVPEKGKKSARGTKVQVVLSSGEESLRTPELLGKTVAQARKDYSPMGIKIIIDGAAGDEESTIAGQVPLPGNPLPPDKTIKVTVKDLSVVPNLLGRTVEDARATLEKGGLSMGAITYQFKPGMAENIVLDQAPKAGLEVEWGTEVNVVLSGKQAPATPSPGEASPAPTPSPPADGTQ